MSEVALRIEERMPWERQKGETARQFAAFCLYRNLPPESRSIRRAATEAAEIGGRKIETVERQFKAWSTLRGWHDRVEVFDTYIDRKRLEARETERQRIDREQMTEGRYFRQMALRRFAGHADSLVEPIDWNEVDASTAFQIYKGGRDGERMAAGLGLGAGVGMIPVSQARQVVQEIFEAMLELVPEDLRSTAIARVQAISDGR